jgi:hypothetical protein
MSLEYAMLIMMKNRNPGHIKIPVPHIPNLHTTSPLFGWEVWESGHHRNFHHGVRGRYCSNQGG